MTNIEEKMMENPEDKKLDLTQDELKDANGGYIVDRGFWSRYWIVSDYTGNVIDSAFFKIDANAICETHTISDYVISEEKYNEWMDRKRRVCRAPLPTMIDPVLLFNS